MGFSLSCPVLHLEEEGAIQLDVSSRANGLTLAKEENLERRRVGLFVGDPDRGRAPLLEARASRGRCTSSFAFGNQVNSSTKNLVAAPFTY